MRPLFIIAVKTRTTLNWLLDQSRMAKIAAYSVICILVPSLSMAQETPQIVDDNPSDNAGNVVYPVSLLTDKEFWLSVIILVFGTITIFLVYRLFHNPSLKTEEVTRTYTVILIIIGTLLLISAGFSNEQIAPALGLFGTIAGYLLGRADRRTVTNEKSN